MDKAEILKKVEQREHEKRCVDSKICPTCGGSLIIEGDDRFLDKVCKACNLQWAYV